MGKINITRVILGGLLAGLVLNIGEWVLNGVFLQEQWAEIMESLNRPPMGGQAVAWLVVLTFVMGIAIVWIYATMRPRFGAGPKTAVIAGLTVWALIWVLSSASAMVMDMYPVSIFLITAAWGLFEVVIASLVGAWPYKED